MRSMASAQATEPMLIEPVVAEGPIEALDEGVLHRFARLDMMQSYAGALSPKGGLCR